MEIESISHKGLRRFFETGNPKGLMGDPARIGKMLAFIVAAAELEELRVPPNFTGCTNSLAIVPAPGQ